MQFISLFNMSKCLKYLTKSAVRLLAGSHDDKSIAHPVHFIRYS